MPRTVHAARYVTPFREGGSVPALVEGDDLGMYVVKLRGAGQGKKALIAEWIGGELARTAGLRVPEIAFVELDRAIADGEPDPEIAEPLERSAGTNLGLDYLPGSVGFDPLVGRVPDGPTASRVVLFDAFALNVDRTVRNTNLLVWHGNLWLIDHGAAFYFHHGWSKADRLEGSRDAFAEVKSHVLLPYASDLSAAAAHLRSAFTDDAIDRVVNALPATWFDDDATPEDYGAWLRARIVALPVFLEEAERAYALRL